jgi:hypothetical protein
MPNKEVVMITGIEIENFKGIRERVRIELKPITLLFGANSAGKSSILHAILYASEVLERRNLDADSTVMGGESIDLGGFKNFVHGHDLDRTVWLKIDCSDDEDLHESLCYRSMTAINEYFGFSQYIDNEVDSLIDPDGVSIELGIAWNQFSNQPYVAEYRLYAREPKRVRYKKGNTDSDERPLLARVTADASGQRVTLTELNLSHGALMYPLDWDIREPDEDGNVASLDDVSYDLFEPTLALCLKECEHCFETISSEKLGEYKAPAILITAQPDALPRLGNTIQLALRQKSELDRVDSDDEEFERIYNMARELAKEISIILLKPLELVTMYLQQSRYLGPIREVPQRDFKPAKSRDAKTAQGRSKWASGRGAWEELANSEELVEITNYWLQDRLESGCSLAHKNYVELDLSDPTIVRLINQVALDDEQVSLSLENQPHGSRIILRQNNGDSELQPSDVGIGISQVVPVIVSAVSGETGLQMIEQPELHLHPRLQAELGDLFVSTFLPDDVSIYNQYFDSLDDSTKLGCPDNLQYYLIETHSEHLILRFLRRIREATDGELPTSVRLLSPDDVTVTYLEGGNTPTIATVIRIDKDGEFLDRWPRGFFEERAKELF